MTSKDEDSGYYARAVGASIFTQAETLDELRLMIKHAIDCHYDEIEERPETFYVVLENAEK